MGFIRYKLKGSTLIEVLIAFAICVVIFSMSLHIILKSGTSDNTEMRLRANIIASSQIGIMSPEEQGTIIDSTSFTNLIVVSIIQPIDSIPGLYDAEVKVLSKKKAILARKFRVLNDINYDPDNVDYNQYWEQ